MAQLYGVMCHDSGDPISGLYRQGQVLAFLMVSTCLGFQQEVETITHWFTIFGCCKIHLYLF